MPLEEEELVTKRKLLNSKKSSLSRYHELAVGEDSLVSLLKYELLTIPFTLIPGALGYYLRRRFAKHLFKQVGSNVIFGNQIYLYAPHKVSLGHNVAISDGCRLDVKGDDNTRMSIGNDVLIGTNTILRSRFGGTVIIANGVSVGDNCIIAARDTSVILGDNVLIGAFCYIIGGRAHSFERLDIPVADQPLLPADGVRIEDGVWVGGGVKILDGITIGKGAIIGAGAVVTQNIPEMSVALGVPASVIRKRE